MTAVALPYFVALPSRPGPWPGVVVIHEANGISPQLLRFCERLAGQGFAAVAPDLFFRSGGSEAKGFAELMGELSPDQVIADLQAAAGILRGLGAGRVGVTGFCMGGLQAWRAAVEGGGFSAAVGFYGAGISRVPGEPRCPTLLFFGGRDEYISPAEIESVVARHPDSVVYPDAGHGFMRDGSDSYHEASAADAWDRTLSFFTDHLA
ncbi:MAG TPA: dienelactone hydrolase family protein [Acidimicrobiales bacterium]|nr:dienelactone hydrolase family protein [Acidimicrobiales bacterium]